jgi:hypothetical protein
MYRLAHVRLPHAQWTLFVPLKLDSWRAEHCSMRTDRREEERRIVRRRDNWDGQILTTPKLSFSNFFANGTGRAWLLCNRPVKSFAVTGNLLLHTWRTSGKTGWSFFVRWGIKLPTSCGYPWPTAIQWRHFIRKATPRAAASVEAAY